MAQMRDLQEPLKVSTPYSEEVTATPCRIVVQSGWHYLCWNSVVQKTSTKQGITTMFYTGIMRVRVAIWFGCSLDVWRGIVKVLSTFLFNFVS